jgi:CYTH domain-containing protein
MLDFGCPVSFKNHLQKQFVKYAHIERERKFLLAGGTSLVDDLPYKIINDHYVKGTQLRFRMVTDHNGSIYKLTQKAESNKGQSPITTIYLQEFEYRLLNIFDSVSVQKTRYIRDRGNYMIGIDKYSKGNDELWLAEIEFISDEEMQNFAPPFNYLSEVTDDISYNGFTLAQRFEADTKS